MFQCKKCGLSVNTLLDGYCAVCSHLQTHIITTTGTGTNPNPYVQTNPNPPSSPPPTISGRKGDPVFSEKLFEAALDGGSESGGTSKADLHVKILEKLQSLPQEGWAKEGVAIFIASLLDSSYTPTYRKSLVKVLVTKQATFNAERLARLRDEWPELYIFLENIMTFELLEDDG